MKFFGWKSAGREASRPVLSRGFSAWAGTNTQGEWPRAYEPQVREGFIGNPVAQRAVRLVSEGAGSAPVSATDPAVLALVTAKSGGQSLIETMAMQLLLHGNAYVQVLPDDAGAPRFQIGEPWWWVMPNHRICLYDDAARAALGGSPVVIDDVRGSLTAPKRALLDAAGLMLAASTSALHAAVRADHPTCERLLLAYLPTVADEAAPELKRANLPLGWATPAFDVLQLEDYDWVTTGNRGAGLRARAEVTAQLGYPTTEQHYFSGFVLNPEDSPQWALIADAAEGSSAAETFIWALPQVLRDGFTCFRIGEDDVTEYDDVDFPLALGRSASVEPGFSTQIITTASGHEQRNADWASGRMRYDAGPGVRSEADLATLIAFFRARRGAAKAFRFRDPLDHSSKDMTGVPGATDQLLGAGDGVRTQFALVKRYGTGMDAEVRPITRPVPVSVRVAVGGVEAVSGWTLGAGGVIDFATAPVTDTAVTAGFRFDVPVRFAEDRLAVSLATFMAGEAAAVELIEVR